jgi:hypothetical protein
MATLFDDRLNISKTPKPKVVMATEQKGVRGMQVPWTQP